METETCAGRQASVYDVVASGGSGRMRDRGCRYRFVVCRRIRK